MADLHHDDTARPGDPPAFGPGYWREVSQAARADKPPRGWVAALLASGLLAGGGFTFWAAVTGFHPLWWRVTVPVFIVAFAAWLLLAWRRARRRR